MPLAKFVVPKIHFRARRKCRTLLELLSWIKSVTYTTTKTSSLGRYSLRDLYCGSSEHRIDEHRNVLPLTLPAMILTRIP
jgi:hypothetical protein